MVGVYGEEVFPARRRREIVNAATIPPRHRLTLRSLGRLSAGLTLGVWLASLSATAFGDCGDAIDGERVPCRCGDIVVADVRLQPDDPIVTEPCPADGLIVRVPSESRSVTVDLNGQEIHGSGTGTGIRILHGGSDGADVVGGLGSVRGVISGFREGIRSQRPDDLRRLLNLIVRDSREAGVVVRGNRASIESVRVEGNAADGLRTSGRSVDLFAVEAEGNGGRGVRDQARSGERDLDSRGNGVEREPRGGASR